MQQVNLVAPWGNDSTFTTGMFFFTILLYHRRPYDYFWDHIKWRPCCLDHPLVFFRFAFWNLSQQNLDRFNDKDSNKKSFTNASIPMKKQKTALSVEGLRGRVWKLDVFGPTFLGYFFCDSRSESSRNLEFRGCFRRSRYALSFGGLVMGFFAKDLFIFLNRDKIKVLPLSGWVFWGHQSITVVSWANWAVKKSLGWLLRSEASWLLGSDGSSQDGWIRG